MNVISLLPQIMNAAMHRDSMTGANNNTTEL